MHTKGPWKLFKGKHSEVVEILDNHGIPVVGWMGFDDSRRSDEEHKANARLITESPTMLLSLESIQRINKSEHPDRQRMIDATCDEAISRVKESRR